MLYRRFGQTQQQMSLFSLGTMRLERYSHVVAKRVIEAALNAGINHIETAQAYGSSESQVGQILADLFQTSKTRAQLYLTTKLSPLTQRDQWRQHVEQSLERLQLTYLDNLALHGINLPEHLDQVLTHGLPELRKLQTEGLIRHIGFSTHGPLDLILKTIQTQAFEFIFLHYYYFNQRNEPALTAATQQDMGVFVISPADKGGLLYRPPQQLQALCQPFSPLALGYHVLIADPRVHTLSLGAETPAELAGALEVFKTIDLWQVHGPTLLQRLKATLDQTLGPERCSQCYACLPCPESIPIPDILRLRNLTLAYEMKQYGQYRYNMLGQAGHWFPGRKANYCTDCGDCLPRCPEQLDIPQLLRDTHDRLHQAPIKRLWE